MDLTVAFDRFDKRPEPPFLHLFVRWNETIPTIIDDAEECAKIVQIEAS